MAEIDDENIVNEDNRYSRVDDTTTEPPFNFSLDQYLSDLKPNPVTTVEEVTVTKDMGLSPYMRTYLNNVQSGAKKAMSNADFGYLGGYFDKRYEGALRVIDKNIQELNISEEDKANIYKDQNKLDQYVQVYNNWRDSGGNPDEFVLFNPDLDPETEFSAGKLGAQLRKREKKLTQEEMRKQNETVVRSNKVTSANLNIKPKPLPNKIATTFDENTGGYITEYQPFEDKTLEQEISTEVIPSYIAQTKFYEELQKTGDAKSIISFNRIMENKKNPALGFFENVVPKEVLENSLKQIQNEYTADGYLAYTKANNLPNELDVNTLNNHFKGTKIYFDMDNGELRVNYGDAQQRSSQETPADSWFMQGYEYFTDAESLGHNSLVVDPSNPEELSQWIQTTLFTAEEEKSINTGDFEKNRNNYYKLQLSHPEKFQSSQINTEAIQDYVVKQKKLSVYLAKRLESDQNEFDKLKGTETIIKYDNLVKEFTGLNDKLTEIKKNLEGKTNPSEKDINDYNLQVENLNKIYQSIEEVKKTDEFFIYSELNKSIVGNSTDLVKINENAKTIEEQNKVVIAKQYLEKEATGSFVGNILSGVYTGAMGTVNSSINLAFDAAVGSGLIKVDDLFGPSYAVDLDKSDTQKYNEFKRELSNVFDNEVINRFTEKAYGTTEEYAQSDKRSDLEKSARMVSEAIGTIIGGAGNKYLTLFGFFSQSYNAINKEMRGEEFDDLTPFEKNILAVPVSIAVGYLDKLGAKVSLGDPLVKNLLLRTLAKSVTEIPKDATLGYVESVVKKTVAKQIALGTLKIVGSSLVEGFTEGTQDVATMGAKAIFNEYYKKDLFNLPDITTKEGREEAKNIVLESIYYGTIGGTIMSSGEQAVSAVKNGFDNSKADAKFDLLYNTITDPELILTVKNAIKLDLANQKITRETAEQRMESVNSVYSLFQSIPKDLSTGQKKEAFNLINEKKRLEQEIEGKDPSLVDAQKKRVSEINESLKTISNNAAKETTNKQQAVTAEGGVSEYQGASEGQQEVGQVEGGQREATVNETDIGNSTIPGKVQEEVVSKDDVERRREEDLSAYNEEGLNEVYSVGSDQTVGEFINAKYDAELAALGTDTKADIKRRREEELDSIGQKAVQRRLQDLREAVSEKQIAQAIINIEKNAKRGAKITKEEQDFVTQKKQELKDKGFEIVDHTGKIWNIGLNLEVLNFKILDEGTNLTQEEIDVFEKELENRKRKKERLKEKGLSEQEIDKQFNDRISVMTTVQPQLNKDGKMVQAAKVDILQIEVSQAEEILERSKKNPKNTQQARENKINAKYDAELSALGTDTKADKTTDENYDISQEVNDNIAKANPDASVLLTPKGNDLSLTAVYVGKEKRGKGIGTKVLETVKSEADRTGKKIILDATNELDSETDLERLSIFYEKNGFKKVGENKFEYNPQETTAKTETKKTEYKQNLVTPENSREIASKQNTPLRQKIAKSAAMIMRALPGVKIYLHNNQSEVHQALANSTGQSLDKVSKEIGNSAGSHVAGEIHINMENANETTMLHEAFHEAILRSGKSIKTIIDFANGLKNIISDKAIKAKLEEFASRYNMNINEREKAIKLENKKRIADGRVAMNEKESDNYISSLEEPTKSDEFLTELGAIMAEAQTELTTTKLQQFLNLINRIAKRLRLPVIIKSSATAQEAVDFINSMARSLRTGEAIVVSDAINVDTNELSIKQQKIGDFDVSYFEDDNEFKKLVKEGLVENNYDINKISGEVVAVHQPDNMFVGTLKNLDKLIFNGNGGVFYTSITGNVWASGAESSAKSLANLINKSLEESTDGVGRLVLVRGTDSKMISSTEGVKASMSIIELLVDKGLINRSEFRSSLIRAGKKFNIDFSGKDSSAAIHKDIKEKFMDVKNSTFQKRGDFFDEVINDLAKTSKSATDNKVEIRKVLGSKRDISFSKDGIRDSIGYILTERLLQDLPNSHAYAIIEVTDPVTYEERKGHDSYPWVLKSKSKPKLKLLSNRGHAVKDGVFEMIDGSVVTQGKLGLAQRGMGIAKISEQQSKIKTAEEAPSKIKKQLIGKNANLSQNVRDNLQVARDMEKANKNAKTIRIATGWERGADKKWRYEVPDIKFKKEFEGEFLFPIDKLKRIPSGMYVAKLSDLFDAKSLFESYNTELQKELPVYKEDGTIVEGGVLYNNFKKLEDINLYFQKGGYQNGEYDPITNDINIFFQPGNSTNEEIAITIAHEIQHYIQEREGFSFGTSIGSTSREAMSVIPKLNALEKEIIEKTKYDSIADLKSDLEKEMDNSIFSETKDYINWEGSRRSLLIEFLKNKNYDGKILKGDLNTPLSEYLKIENQSTKKVGYADYIKYAGEVESRNVEKRINLTPEERRQTTLQETEDVSREDQIIFFGEGTPSKIKQQKTTQETRMDKESEAVFKESLDLGTTWATATQNALDYIQKSKWYQDATDIEREQKVRDFKESKKQKLKKAPSVAKILGTPKPKMVTVNEAAAFKDQLRLEAKAAREAKGDLNFKRKSLSDAIKGIVKLGKLKVQQANTIITRVSKVNLDSSVQVERLIEYASRVFERADYQDRLDRAFSYKRAIKKLLKTNNQAQVVGMANEFTKLDPSLVENIEEYIDIAEKVKKAVAPSRAKPFILDKENYFDIDPAKGFDMALKQATNIEAVSKFVKDELEKQEQQLKDELLATNNDLFESGVLSTDMTAKQMQEIVDAIKKDPAYKIDSKENEKYMMAYLLKRFESLAGTVEDIIKTNQNPVTGERVAIDQKDVAIMSDLLKVDLSEMGVRDALFIVEAMDNFITNGITSKLEAALSAYKGQMGLKKEIKSGKVARPLKLYFSKKAGRALAIEFTPLPLMIERMFTGVRSGISVMDSIGLNIVINGVNKANYLHNKIIDEYYNKFIRKSKTFHKPENVYERGMLSFLKRNVTGSLQEMKSETNRRVRMITQSITTLKDKGNKLQKAMAEIYQKVFDKLGVSTGDIDVIESRASKENRDAVDWWMKEWSKHYKDLADVSLSVYNYDLGSDINYSSPDVYKTIKTEEFDQKLIERNSSFLISMDNYTDKEKTGVLMQSKKPDAMEEGRYLSFDFDANNSNSLKGALVDTNTAAGIRQVDGFLNSKLLDKLIPSTEDRDALVMRVNRYIRRSKGKVFAPKDLYKDADDVLSFAARLGVGKALGGVLQSVKQTAPIALSTALMTGKFNIPSVSFNEWLNKTGMGTANRGLDSLSAIESVDRRLDAKATGFNKPLKWVQKTQQLYLKWFLSKPDVMIARMAFQSYYLQYMGKTSIDWDNHTPNQNALNYAEAMVGRQQNINDPMLGGEFLTAEDSMKRMSKKILFPFASFGLNQKARLNSDLINMGAKTTSFEDRKIAFKSASATIAEMVAYRAIMVGISYEFYKVANDIINYFLGDGDDDDDDKERDKKWLLSAAKFPIKSMINDLVSPLPLLDEYVTMGADYILSLNTGYTEAELDELVKQENEIRGLKDLDPLEGRQLKKFREEKKEESLYQLAGKYESSKFGMGSIFYDAALKFYDEYQLAMTGEFKDEYRGNITTKKIRPVEQELIKNSLIFSALFMLEILPKEADQMTTKVVNMIKKNAMSESEYEKYEGFKKEYKREPGYLEMALIRSDKKQDYIENELNFIKDEGGLSLVQAKEYVKIFNLINEVTPDDLSKIKEGQTADQIIKSLKKEYKERISEVETETKEDEGEVFKPIKKEAVVEEVFKPTKKEVVVEEVLKPIETNEETEEVFQPIEPPSL